jgi:HEPN domain-containing protein
MKPITQEWLNRASDDLDVVEEIIDIAHLTNIAAFHCQQAIEKSFKAVLEEHSEVIPRVHNLVRLYNIVKDKLNFTVDELVLKEISDIYTEARYPGELGLLPYGKPTVEDAKRFYGAAKPVYNNVNSLLASEWGPSD